MIPILIGAAVAGAAGAAACKLFDDKPKKKLREWTWTRIIPESEVPPDIVEKIRQKELARLKRDSDKE